MNPDYLALIPEPDGREVWRPVSFCHKVDPRNMFAVVTVLDGPRTRDTVQVPVHNLRSPDVFTALGEPPGVDAWALP